MEEKAAHLFNMDEQAHNGQATSGEVETTETLSLVVVVSIGSIKRSSLQKSKGESFIDDRPSFGSGTNQQEMGDSEDQFQRKKRSLSWSQEPYTVLDFQTRSSRRPWSCP
jgi:hypothetical protein